MDKNHPVNQMRILHGALLIGVLVFIAICIYIHEGLGIGDSLAMLPEQAFYLVILIAGSILLGGNFIFRKMTSDIGNELTLQEKITKYRGASILRAAMIESAALVIVIGYMLSGNTWYLIVEVVPLFYFWNTFPNEDKMYNELDLTYREQHQLGSP